MRNFGNIILVIVLLLLMNHSLLGSVWHEYFGVAYLLFVLVHVSYAHGWFRNLFLGRQSLQRLLGTSVSLLLIMVMLITIVTGLLISTTVFPVVQLHGAASIFAQELHQGGAYVSFILIGIHFGLHWSSLWIRVKKQMGIVTDAKSYKWAVSVFASIVIGYAIYASFIHHMGDRLMMEHMMDFGDSGSPLSYSLDLTVIFAGYAIVAYICKSVFVTFK